MNIVELKTKKISELTQMAKKFKVGKLRLPRNAMLA